MISLDLAKNIRTLNVSWRALLEESPSELATHTLDDSLQNISAGLVQCVSELESNSSSKLVDENKPDPSGGHEARVAAVLRETALAREGLIGTAAAAALQKATLHVTLKTQALELCRLIVLSDYHNELTQDPEALEELVELCLSLLALDSSHKVKRAAVRLIRSALAPETGRGLYDRRGPHPRGKLRLGADVVGRLLERLSAELSQGGKRLATSVRSELLVVTSALLSSFKGYPSLTDQWRLPLLEQIVHRLEAAGGAPTTGHTETLGALEALREMLSWDKAASKLLPSWTWGRVYAYVVTVGTQNVLEDGGGYGAAVATTRIALQQAALLVLLEGTVAFARFIDRDIASDFSHVSSHTSKEEELHSGNIKKKAKSWTLLDRLLALTASSHVGLASSASRALSGIVGSLAAAAAAGRAASSASDFNRGLTASATATITKAPEDSSTNAVWPYGGELECAAALRCFIDRVVAELHQESLLQHSAQASKPEGWWQQNGSRGFAAHRCLSFFCGEERRIRGMTAAFACLRLATAGCGPSWRQQHGPSCSKHALHLFAAASAICCQLLDEAGCQETSVGTSPGLKKRKLLDAMHQGPSPKEGRAQMASSVPQQGEQKQRFLAATKAEGGAEVFVLPSSLCMQLRKVFLFVFDLHAKAGVLPRSLVPKAAAALRHAARALVLAAAAEEAAAAMSAAAATAGTLGIAGWYGAEDTDDAGGAEGTAKADEGDAEEVESASQGGAAAAALRRIVQESVLLALQENPVQPPTFISVADLWKTVLVGDGRYDYLGSDLGDEAYTAAIPTLNSDSSNVDKNSSSSSSSCCGRDKRVREAPGQHSPDKTVDTLVASAPVCWRMSLSAVLLEELLTCLKVGVDMQAMMQQWASSGMGTFTQFVFQSAGNEDEEETAATEGLFLLNNASLVASSFVTAPPAVALQAAPAATVAVAGGSYGVVNEEGEVGDDLVNFALGIAGGRSQALVLHRLAGFLCRFFSDSTIRRRFLSSTWLVAFLDLLKTTLISTAPGPGLLAILQVAKPIVAEWKSRESANNKERRCSTFKSQGTDFGAAAAQPAAEPAFTVTPPTQCDSCCCVTEGTNPFGPLEEAMGHLLQAVEAGTVAFSAEETAAAVALLLEAPDNFIFPQHSLLVRTLQRALRLGRADLPLASAAVASLRRWIMQQQEQKLGRERQLLQAVLPLLRPFLEAYDDKGGSSAAAARSELLQEAVQAGLTDSHRRLIVSGLDNRKRFQIGGGANATSPEWRPYIVALRRSVLLLLGELGPQRATLMFGAPRHLSLSGALALHSCEEWAERGNNAVSPETFLRVSLPLGRSTETPWMCVPLQGFIVRVARAAVDAPSRQERATLCELLYALVCCVSQRAASALYTTRPGRISTLASGGEAPRAAAVAIAALYRAVLPSVLELIALTDQIPRQLLSPLLLRCIRDSVDAVAAPTPTSDPRLPAVLEVLSEGLRDDSASLRSTAAAASVALVFRVLRRLNGKRDDAPATVFPAASKPADALWLDEALHTRDKQCKLLLLQRILEQTLLVPLSHAESAQRLGGLAVFAAVLPLGGRPCHCTAARHVLLETVFKALIVLLREGMQGSSNAEVVAKASWRCCSYSLVPAALQCQHLCKMIETSAATVSLQYLHGILMAGKFLVDMHRSACLVEAATAAQATASSAAPEAGDGLLMEKKRRQYLLLQSHRLMKHLRHLAVVNGDRRIQGLCRSLLLQFEANNKTGGAAAAAATAAAAAAAGERLDDDWALSAIEELKVGLEAVLFDGRVVSGDPPLSSDEEAARQLFLLLDNLLWVVENSSEALMLVAKDSRILRCLRAALRAVWLKGRKLDEKGSFGASVELATITLSLSLLKIPFCSGEGQKEKPATEEENLLLYAILDQPAEEQPVEHLGTPFSKQQSIENRPTSTVHKERKWYTGSRDNQPFTVSLVRSLVVFLVQPAALGFTSLGAEPLCLRLLGVSVLKALEPRPTETRVAAEATGGCQGGTTHLITLALKKWVENQRKKPVQKIDGEEVRMYGLSYTRRNPWAQQGSSTSILNELFHHLLPAKTERNSQSKKSCCQVAALHAYVEGLEALEEAFGCGCLFEEPEEKTLLLTGTSAASAARAAVSTAAYVLRGTALHVLEDEADFMSAKEDKMPKRSVYSNLNLMGNKWRQQVVTLLLRFALLCLRCSANSAKRCGDIQAPTATTAAELEALKWATMLQEEAQTFLAIAAFPLKLLVPSRKQMATAHLQPQTCREAANAASVVSTLRSLRCSLFGLSTTRRSPLYVHLLRVLYALIRHQTATAAAPVSAASDNPATPRAGAAVGTTSVAGRHEKEEQQLLDVVLNAFELWQSSAAWGDREQGMEDPSVVQLNSAPPVSSPLLRGQYAALADVFCAVASWNALLKGLPHRGGALQFVGDRTARLLSGSLAVSTPVRAAALRGGFVAMILADFFHEAQGGECRSMFTDVAVPIKATQPTQHQELPRLMEEERAIGERRGRLSASLLACSSGVSEMIAAVFPLTSADLRGERSQTLSEAKTYATLLNALLDSTLTVFEAAALCEASAPVKSGAPCGRVGDRDSGTERCIGGLLDGERRRYYGLSLCLTHLHDTLREDHHGFQQRLQRFLTSLVTICSQHACDRLCLFVITHCLNLLLADVPAQPVTLPAQQMLDKPAFRGRGLASRRPPLGPRLVEVLALPLLFAAGKTKVKDSSTSFFFEVWSLLWRRLAPLLSLRWAAVGSISWGTPEKQKALSAAVRHLQVFASACGFIEVLFSVTPVALFKDSVAPFLLQGQHPNQTATVAEAAAASATSGPTPGSVVTRQVISAMSSAMRTIDDVIIPSPFLQQQQGQQQVKEKPREAAEVGLSELLRFWLWRGRVRAYGCLSAAVCSTQSNASLYVSLLVSDSARLSSMIEQDVLSISQQMRQQGDTAVPLWAPSAGDTRQQQQGSYHSFSFAAAKQRPVSKWGEALRSREEPTWGRFSLHSATASLSLETQKILSQTFCHARNRGRSNMFLQLSQSLPQTRVGVAMATRFFRDPTVKQVYSFTQRFETDTIGAQNWLHSLSLGPGVPSAFAAAEMDKIAAAAAGLQGSAWGSAAAARCPQEQVEALLSGRTEDTAGFQYDDAVGRSALLQLLLRVVDCAIVRFGSEWKAAADTGGANHTPDVAAGPLDFLLRLPLLMQCLLHHCSSCHSTPATAVTATADAEGDRAWALRLIVLRVFIQRADVLSPFAERGLLDFVAESVADRRLIGAKRLHFWLRDMAWLLTNWLQLPLKETEGSAGLLEGRPYTLAPLRPLTAARLAAFAEALIRLSTSNDSRTHKLNLVLVGAFLQRLHFRLSVQESSNFVLPASGAPHGIHFLHLPLRSFFVYESARSVEETSKFRLSGIAVAKMLCALEREKRSALHLGGGPYSGILCNKSFLLAASRALLFPKVAVAVQAAGMCGSLLSVFPLEPRQLDSSSGREQQTKPNKIVDQLETGTAFFSSFHRRLQQLSAAEMTAASGKTPSLYGGISLRSYHFGQEETHVGAETRQQVQNSFDEEAAALRDGVRDPGEEDRAKLLLYSFNYDGRYAACAAALAAEQPLAFLGVPGSVPRDAFWSLVSHIKLLRCDSTTRSASVQRKRARKGAALLDAIRNISCCDVAEEVAKSPGCAYLAVAVGAAEGKVRFEKEMPVSPFELAVAQEKLQEWQRQSTDPLVEAMAFLWGDLLSPQQDSGIVLAALSLLRSLLKRWGDIESLFGAFQAVASLLKTPPSDTEVAAALFEICVWLRSHSQEYEESPSLLSFMLAKFPNHPELRRTQLDYWFGTGGALPEAPSERIAFLLSAGLSEASAPHMLHLLTAAICYQQPQQRSVQQQEQHGFPPQAWDRTKLTPSSSLAELAAIVLRDDGTLGATVTAQPFDFSKQNTAADASFSLMQGRGRMVERRVQAQETQKSLPLSLLSERAARLACLSGGDRPLHQSFQGGFARAPWKVFKGSTLASEPSSEDEVDLLVLEIGEPNTAQESSDARRFSGGGRCPMSRATAIAIQERKRRKVHALLQRHQNALGGREDSVVLIRNHWSAGDPLRYVVSPEETLHILGEASRLNISIAADFLFVALAAHSTLPDGILPQHADLRLNRTDAADQLGLASAGKHALERCCEENRSNTSWCRNRPLLCFLQRLALQTFFQRETTQGRPLACLPMQLYELARATETLEVALPLLEEMTCRQQQILLHASGRSPSLALRQQTVKKAAEGLRPFFSSLLLGYRDLGQFDAQRSVVQSLALYRCFKPKVINTLLRLWWDTDDAVLRQEIAETLRRDSATVLMGEEYLCAKTEATGIMQQHHEEPSEEHMAKRLLRDAHMESLQRMMQWETLVDCYCRRTHDGNQESSGIGEGPATPVHAARRKADMQECVELGGGCLVRAALAVSLRGGNPAAGGFLQRLTRLLSPVYFLHSDSGEIGSQDNFAAALPTPLKASLYQLLSLHAVTQGSALEASFFVAEAESALQGLVVSGLANAPSSLVTSVLTRLALSHLIKQGVFAMQENISSVDRGGSTTVALDNFLAKELTGNSCVVASKRPTVGESEVPFRHCIETTPLSDSISALLAIRAFLGVMDKQLTTTSEPKLKGHMLIEGGFEEGLERQHAQLPWRLLCCAVSTVAQKLVRDRGGVRAASALLRDMLEQQRSQQQLLQKRDLTLLSTVIKLKLKEVSREASPSTNAVGKAQQLLRLVQQERHHLLSASGHREGCHIDGERGQGLLIALQLSCHSTILHEMQRRHSFVASSTGTGLAAAVDEALKTLQDMRECQTYLFSKGKTEARAVAALDGVADSTDISGGQLKGLWRCATLAKEIISSLQEAGKTPQQEKRGGDNMAATAELEGYAKRRIPSVVQLFCSLVVDLVALGGSNSKYGKKGAALLPAVLLLCAEASRACRPPTHRGSLAICKDERDEKLKETQTKKTTSAGMEESNEWQSKENVEGKDAVETEKPAALEYRLTRLMEKVPVEVLSVYFPQLLSFISADLSGCLSSAVLPRLYAVIERDPYGAFYALKTATSAALCAGAAHPYTDLRCFEAASTPLPTVARKDSRPPPTALLDLLCGEALRRAPLAAHFCAACEMLQLPERRLHQQLLQPLLGVLEEAFGRDITDHEQSERHLPPAAAARWQRIWKAACNAAVIDDRHAVLGEAFDSHTKGFASRMKIVIGTFCSEHCKGCDSGLPASPTQRCVSFAEKSANSVVGLPARSLMALLRLLTSAATDQTADASYVRRGVLRLSSVSPWLAGFSADCISLFDGLDANILHPDRRLPVPFLPTYAYVSAESLQILSFCDRVIALPSKQTPLRLSFCATDGYCYSFLAKGEDLRLDQRIQTLMQLLANLGESRTVTGRGGLRLRSYGVMPMSEGHGIVEWISCTSPLSAVCEAYTGASLAASPACMRYAAFLRDMVSATAGAIPNKANSPSIAEVWSTIFGLPAARVEDMFMECVELAATHVSPAAADTAQQESGSSRCCARNRSQAAHRVPPAKAILQCMTSIVNSFEELSIFRKRFGASLATSAAVCYCLGTGDRHLGNCLLDLKTGECIDVDFGYAFDVAIQALPVPEIAPFRLSPCLLQVVGPPGARDYALFHSPLFNFLSSDKETIKGSYGPFCSGPNATPTHAFAVGALGPFESCFAEALDFVRNNRLVVEAVVEMVVREPFSPYCEAGSWKAATWRLQEETQGDVSLRETVVQLTIPANEEAATQEVRKTEEQRVLATTVAAPFYLARMPHSFTGQESRREAEKPDVVARRCITSVMRKLRGEHPSLLLLDLLKTHCEPYVASAVASPTSELHAMVVGSQPPRTRWSFLSTDGSAGCSEDQQPCYESRHLSAREQARCLIELATDANILGRAWKGLQTFI